MIAQLDWKQVRLRPGRALARITSHLLLQGRPVTTRMRWLNNVLFAQFFVVKRLPQLRRAEKPIFILGTGRSGTTVLGKVLSLHPCVTFLNEPKALWHAVHPGEDIVGSYTDGPGRYRLDASDATPEVRDIAHRLYGYSLAITRSQRILDKYPELIFRVSFIKAIFPDAKLVFLVRNGWDTCRSIEAWSRQNSVVARDKTLDWWGIEQRKWELLVRDVVAKDPTLAPRCDSIRSLKRQEDKAVVEWLATMHEGMRLLESMPDQLLQIHYEDLTRNAESTMEIILAFCDLPQDQVMLRYATETLKPLPSKPPFPIHAAIEPVFIETMERIGY